VRDARPRKNHRGIDLISDALPFGRLWYGEPNAIENAIGYAKFRSPSHDAVIRVYDEAGNVIQTHEHAGEFKVRWVHYFGLPAAPSLTAENSCFPFIQCSSSIKAEIDEQTFVEL
jgi:hypothetical protein